MFACIDLKMGKFYGNSTSLYLTEYQKIGDVPIFNDRLTEKDLEQVMYRRYDHGEGNIALFVVVRKGDEEKGKLILQKETINYLKKQKEEIESKEKALQDMNSWKIQVSEKEEDEEE